MTEILFYQLERAPLERVLPDLLEKSLAKGWRAIVQTSTHERLQALDASLWTYEESSFLPHATDGQEHAPNQPVLLTLESANQNDAHIRFLVDGADIDDVTSYVRAIYMFNGRDADELSQARTRWKAYKGSEHELTYWAQSETGKWEKKG